MADTDAQEPSNIWTAAGDGDLARVQELIASGIPVDAQDEFGYTALHAACSYRNVEVARWLLSQNASASVRDSEGDTALAQCEDPACAQLLLAAGADLFTVNDEGATPYHISIWECREEMSEWLKQQYEERGVPLPEVGEEPGAEGEAEEVYYLQAGEGAEGEGEGEGDGEGEEEVGE